MNIQSSKIITIGIIVMAALALLGVSGTISPASAAGMVINNNARVTNYAQVKLDVTAPAGYVEMRFQNESNPPSAWEPVSATRHWTLSAGTGLKTVAVQFRDANKITTSINDFKYMIIYDSIIDTSFNAGSSSYPGTANFANSAAVVTAATAANAVAVYPNAGNGNDGKTVTVGTYDNGNGTTNIKVVRYNTNGTIDKQYVFLHNGLDTGNGVAIDSNGKIVVVGTYSRSAGVTDIFLLRLNSDVTTDTGFGVNGVIDYIASGRDSGNAVAIDPLTDTIVVAGTHDSSSPSAWVLRFDDVGSKIGDVGFLGGTANAVAIQDDQKIVVVGTHNDGPSGTSSWVMRLNSDGTIDDSTFNSAGNSPGHNFFGTDGLHTGNAVAIDPATNKIVVVGTFGGSQAWVLQLNTDGTLDPSFNYVGSVAFEGPVATSGNAVAIQPLDGKIVVVGTSVLGDGTSTIFVARLKNSGSMDDPTFLDTSFDNGSYDYAFGTAAQFAGRAVALQPDGNIIVAGIGEASRLNTFIPIGSTSMLTLRLHDKTYPLTVDISGSGTVAAFPGTLSNGSGNFVPGSTIQLTATPVGGATFAGWSGDCTGTGICTVTMDSAKNVEASFTQSYELNVSVTGVGTVVSAPVTINCNSASGPGCSADFLDGTLVTLTATPPTWYSLLNSFWSGGSCSGSTSLPCVVTMDQARTVIATYVPGSNARVVGYGDYPTLTEAYSVANATGLPATIQAKDSNQLVFMEQQPFVFDQTVTVTLNGGKGSDFSAAAVGYTSVIGPLKISNGRLNATYLKIKPL